MIDFEELPNPGSAGRPGVNARPAIPLFICGFQVWAGHPCHPMFRHGDFFYSPN